MKSYTELLEEVQKTQKDPRYLKHANRELKKLRNQRAVQKEQGAQNAAAKDNARAKMKERELKRERESKEKQSVQKVDVKIHEPESKPKSQTISKETSPKPKKEPRQRKAIGKRVKKDTPNKALENWKLKKTASDFPGDSRTAQQARGLINLAQPDLGRSPKKEDYQFTFKSFCEATEADLKNMGANSGQIAKLKARQAKRGYGFQSNDERNKTAPAKTQNQISQRNTVKPKTSMDNHVSNVASNRNSAEKSALAKKDNVSRIRTSASPTGLRRDPNAPKPGTPKPEPKGGALATRPADKGSDIVRQKQKSSAIQRYRHPGMADEKQSGNRPVTSKPKPKGYLGKVKDAAGDQLRKNTENTFGAKSVGKKLGNLPGNAAKAAGKVTGRTFRNLMKQSGSNEGDNKDVKTLKSPTRSIS